MRPSQVPPLAAFRVISTRMHTPQSLAWSCDGELAVAADDSLHIYLPHFRNEPRLGEGEETSSEEDGEGEGGMDVDAEGGDGDVPDSAAAPRPERPWFLRKHVAGRRQYSAAPLRILMPQATDPRANAGLLAREGAAVEFDEDEDDFAGVGSGVVTGFGSALNQVVGVQWSPSGLGPNLRPIAAAMLTKGMVLAYGEAPGEKRGGAGRGAPGGGETRDFRSWRLLWGLGGSMPLPDGHGFSARGDRIKAYAWAAEVGPGRALMGYHADADELVVVAVQYLEVVEEAGMNSGGPAWRIDEVARARAPGPHVGVEVHDPDYVPCGTPFSIKWTPWLARDGGRTALIAYIAPNHVGFRRVTLADGWKRGAPPEVRVTEEDVLGICCHLTNDAFVVWEDAIWDADETKVCRGVIATPFTARVFQVDMLGGEPAAKPRHRTRDCGTVYPPASDATQHYSPITGILIQPPPPGSTIATHPVPIYTLTRLVATSTTKDWFQHNHPDPAPEPPAWATAISKLTTSTVPESQAHHHHVDSDSASSASSSSSSSDEDNDNDNDNNTADAEVHGTDARRIAPRRARIWAVAQSPAAGATAVLFSKHSTLMPDRTCRSRVAFSTRRPRRVGEGTAATAEGEEERGLSAEGRAWEWMYGGGPEVRGFSAGAEEPVLGDVFGAVREGMGCALCQGGLESGGEEFVCTAGHIFARCATSSLPILSPSTSRPCSLCARPNLLPEELLRLADEHGLSAGGARERILAVGGDVCSACGGKFVV